MKKKLTRRKAKSKRRSPSQAAEERPLVVWTQRDAQYPSLTATCSYCRPNFTVVVRHDSGRETSESFAQTYEPRWGMDVLDQQTALEAAIRLADALAKELGLA